MARLHLGCGGQTYGFPGLHEEEKDWINVDLGIDPALRANPLSNEIIDGFPRVVEADMGKLPFPDDFATEIFSNHALEHLSQHAVYAALPEWRRVLRPGGRCHIIVPDLLGIAKKLVETDGDMLWSDRGERTGDRERGYTKLLVGIYGEDWSGPFAFHKNGFTPRYMRECLANAGFRDITTKQIWAMEIFSLEAVAFK